jgi:hypothetical protein
VLLDTQGMAPGDSSDMLKAAFSVLACVCGDHRCEHSDVRSISGVQHSFPELGKVLRLLSVRQHTT